MVEPLASYGNYINTNLSRSISLSITDQNQNDIFVDTHFSNPIEIIIPRDPNAIIPPMILQNVTDHNESFYMKFIDINQNVNVTTSIHFEIQPLSENLSYLFIYQFDHSINFNQLDGSSLLCSSSNSSALKFLNLFCETRNKRCIEVSRVEVPLARERNIHSINNSS
jgi:hypothetical protein